MSLHESAMNRIHEILKQVWSREYSADDGLEEIEIQLMGYDFEPEARQIIANLVEYAECNDPGNPHLARAKGVLSEGSEKP